MLRYTKGNCCNYVSQSGTTANWALWLFHQRIYLATLTACGLHKSLYFTVKYSLKIIILSWVKEIYLSLYTLYTFLGILKTKKFMWFIWVFRCMYAQGVLYSVGVSLTILYVIKHMLLGSRDRFHVKPGLHLNLILLQEI